MFLQPQLFLFLLSVSVLIYWTIPASSTNVRYYWLNASSMLVISLAAPAAVLICIVISWIVYLFGNIFKNKRNKLFFWAGIFLTASPAVILDLGGIDSFIVALGVSYFVIKSIGTLIDAYYSGTGVDFKSVLLLNMFFPIFSSGPIEKLETFGRMSLANGFKPEYLMQGSSRILVGIFKTFFVAENLVKLNIDSNYPGLLSNPGEYTLVQVSSYILLNFSYLYINFSGYSDIAIGASRLFSFRIVENFNFPFLATNLQEFWTRWHISLRRFINDYIYLRLLVILRRPYVSIFTAFILVGLWHNISMGYLIWGVGHGAGLVATSVFSKKTRHSGWLKSPFVKYPYVLVTWGLTMFYVSALSFVANNELPVVNNIIISIVSGGAN